MGTRRRRAGCQRDMFLGRGQSEGRDHRTMHQRWVGWWARINLVGELLFSFLVSHRRHYCGGMDHQKYTRP